MPKSYYLIKLDVLYSFNDEGSDRIVIRRFQLEGSSNASPFTRIAANILWRQKRKIGYRKIELGDELRNFLIKWKADRVAKDKK